MRCDGRRFVGATVEAIFRFTGWRVDVWFDIQTNEKVRSVIRDKTFQNGLCQFLNGMPSVRAMISCLMLAGVPYRR